VHPGLEPDLTVLFDVSAEVSHDRIARIKSPDRFERENAEFFMRVRNAYLERINESPARFLRIDGAQAILQIQTELAKHFTLALSKWKP
jgi:dTMP kinase